MRVNINGTQYERTYSSFAIANEADKYRLSISGYSTPNGLYDSLNYHNGMQFSTSDNENDTHSSINCATSYG